MSKNMLHRHFLTASGSFWASLLGLQNRFLENVATIQIRIAD